MHSEKPSDIELLPPLDIMSKISDLSNLDNSGIESNIPNPINSMYYYPSDFRKLNLSSSGTHFSLFHINLNSLDAHLDDLQTTLASLDFPFHVIGISELERIIQLVLRRTIISMVSPSFHNLPDLLLVVWLFMLVNL